MRAHMSFVGEAGDNDDIFLELEQIPRVGDALAVPGLSQGHTVVRTVVWYLFGEVAEEAVDDAPLDETPFVYLVVGQPRPEWA